MDAFCTRIDLRGGSFMGTRLVDIFAGNDLEVEELGVQL